MKSIEKAPSNEAETLERIVSELPRLLDGLEIVGTEILPRAGRGYQPDLLVDVRLGRQSRRLIVEVKTLGEPRFAAQAIAQLGGSVKSANNGYPVFAARYVGETARRLCRAAGVGYLDLLGNVYLKFGGVLIDRLAQGSFGAEQRGLKQLFAPKATRVIRALLLDPRRAMRITDLARECTMSPAGVYWVVRLLEDKGYVGRDSSKRILLTKPKELLDMWAANWTVERNEFKDYFSLEKSPELRIKKFAEFAETKGIQYAFTLMAGASLVAPFVRYQVVWVYVEGDERRIIEGLDLRPVEGGGNIVLVRPYDEGVFQGLQVVDGVKAVSNVQLYVDLYNFRARGREQAEFLRERVIRF